MKKWLIAAILSVAIFASIIGCTEKQMQQADQIADTVEDVTEGGQAILESPAGAYIPPEARLALEIGGALAMGLVIAWRDWRRKQAQTAVKEIVSGIEIAKNDSESTKTAIKDAQKIVQSSKTTELVSKARTA